MYDDADIRVVFQPGGSEVLLITFGDAAIFADGLSFAADTAARKLGLTSVGFMAHGANWFPVDAMLRALPFVEYTLKSFSRVLIYGSSMGGYAAIKHSRLLHATEVIALAPQWSIDAAECASFTPGYQERFVPSMAGMGIKRQDVAGRVAIFFDPGLAADLCHVQAIRRADPGLTMFHVNNVGHHLAPVLASSETLLHIFLGWLHADQAAVTRALNKRRRTSPIRTRMLLEKAVRRHPAMALHAIGYVVSTRGAAGIDSRDHIGVLLKRSLAAGRHAAARRILQAAAGAFPQQRARLLDRDLAKPPGRQTTDAGGLLTFHGGIVFYDAVCGTLCHHTGSGSSVSVGQYPVHLAGSGAALRLVIAPDENPLSCVLDPAGHIELADDADLDGRTCIFATQVAPASVHLKAGAFYVSATPDGNIHHDRLEANNWEVFRTVTAPSISAPPTRAR